MQDLPKVSINIPTYNQAHCIGRTIESALAQDYSNLEVIVSDDCSPDNTSEIVAKYTSDPRFKYHRNKVNIGRVKNYKKCLEELASGEWVVNCDGDDFYIDSSFVSEVMDMILQHKGKTIVFAQGGKIKQYPDYAEYSLPDIDGFMASMSGEEYFFRSKDHDFFAHVSTIYHRDIATSIDFYKYDILSTDRESFLRLALHGDVILIKKAYAKWVGHDNNFSRRTDLKTITSNINYIESAYDYAKSAKLSQEKLDTWHKDIIINFYTGWMDRIVNNNANPVSRILLLQKLTLYMIRNHLPYLFRRRVWIKLLKAHLKALIK